MNGETLFSYCIFGCLVVFIFVLAYQYKNVQLLLDAWARENKYTILSKQYAFLWRGPFWWSSSNQTVYRIKVQDKCGQIKSGWVRLTNFTWASGKVPYEAVWDDEKA
jgi:hypothetical protein